MYWEHYKIDTYEESRYPIQLNALTLTKSFFETKSVAHKMLPDREKNVDKSYFSNGLEHITRIHNIFECVWRSEKIKTELTRAQNNQKNKSIQVKK